MNKNDTNLNFSQTRRLYLAGTVALPVPFPTVGEITIDKGGKIIRSEGGDEEPEPLVILNEYPGNESSITHIILAADVAAIFIPDDQEADHVYDFKKGKWRLPPIARDPNADKPKKDDSKKKDHFKGIVFVPEQRSVLTIDERGQTAGDIARKHEWGGCEVPCER